MSQKNNTEIAVPVNIYIRQEKDHLIRCHKDSLYYYDNSNKLDFYKWSDGDKSCDCERSVHFYKNDEEDMMENIYCGDDYFRVRICDENDKIIYDEWENKKDDAEVSFEFYRIRSSFDVTETSEGS